MYLAVEDTNKHLGLVVFYESELIHKETTEYQEVIIFDNKTFGRMLMLNGSIQLSEKDESIYHTNMVGGKIETNDSKVLIIGGGDGGILREVVKETKVSEITLVELDERIIELSKKYLPFVSNGAFNDPRLNIIIGDGVDYLSGCQEKYDIIFMDCTDPDENSKDLYTEQIYIMCNNALRKNGKLIVQVPLLNETTTDKVSNLLNNLFAEVVQTKINILSFAFGELTIFCASK
jgi:spermidine synthase